MQSLATPAPVATATPVPYRKTALNAQNTNVSGAAPSLRVHRVGNEAAQVMGTKAVVDARWYFVRTVMLIDWTFQ